MTSIAIFDYRVAPTNPIGGCHRQILEALSSDYDFTVFAIEFDNPSPERIDFQRIPVPRRPLALLFIAYHVMAPICYLLHRLRQGRRFDLVQTVESNLSFGRIAYTHFCHRAYLRRERRHSSSRNLRQWLRWLDHRLHAALEPWIYRQVERVVVPSTGTAHELAREYPVTRNKITVIYNPIDTERMCRPDDFDQDLVRHKAGWTKDDRVLVFVALGHFERKGLPVLLKALKRVRNSRLKLFVVGGEQSTIAAHQAQARRLGLQNCVWFTGHRDDVRPYLWSADAFILPSHYETFSLVAAEAAAAGLPVIAPMLHGISEWIRDEKNGLVIMQTTDSVASALKRLWNLDRSILDAMGAEAAADVRRFALDNYAPQWRRLYDATASRT
jgi:glycosyltransferase involved in cell wall biosynthesis